MSGIHQVSFERVPGYSLEIRKSTDGYKVRKNSGPRTLEGEIPEEVGDQKLEELADILDGVEETQTSVWERVVNLGYAKLTVNGKVYEWVGTPEGPVKDATELVDSLNNHPDLETTTNYRPTLPLSALE